MLRRRYYKKEKVAGKAKGRQKANAPVRNGTGAQRSLYRSPEDGFLIYSPEGEESFPWPLEQCLCFTGHRKLSQAAEARLRWKLREALRSYYAQGKRVFLSGGALGFDTLAAQAVLELKRSYPDVRLYLALPCHGQSSHWAPRDQQIYQGLLAEADEVHFVSEEYFPGCMQKRNLFLVNHADTCLCYLTHTRGGTWNTVSRAYDLHRRIVNLAENE